MGWAPVDAISNLDAKAFHFSLLFTVMIETRPIIFIHDVPCLHLSFMCFIVFLDIYINQSFNIRLTKKVFLKTALV